jgi:hypothetical protein
VGSRREVLKLAAMAGTGGIVQGVWEGGVGTKTRCAPLCGTDARDKLKHVPPKASERANRIWQKGITWRLRLRKQRP